jgi:hypothetical protein
MTFNKWTLGLAAVGLVSLASAAKAEEKANVVQTALSSTTISGYVDTSAQWNFGTGNANMPEYRFGGTEKADGFNLNVVQLRIEKPLDEAEWAAGYRADLWFGPDANTLGTSSTGDSNDLAIRQAYVALRTPVGNGLDWKMGVFDSIIGYESVESGNNPNYTRSYGHTLEPLTHTGILGSYRFSDMVSASFGVANTVNDRINSRATEGGKAESYKAYMGSIALTAPESMGFLAGSTLYGGIVNGFGGQEDAFGDTIGNGNQINYYVGATLATPVAGLRLGTSLDVLDVYHAGGESWALAGYASYQATEKLSFHARGEYLRDRGEQKVLTDMESDKILGVTLTAQYDLWQNVISRLELRWDHALDSVETFGGDVEGVPSLKNAWMLAANVIYKF